MLYEPPEGAARSFSLTSSGKLALSGFALYRSWQESGRKVASPLQESGVMSSRSRRLEVHLINLYSVFALEKKGEAPFYIIMIEFLILLKASDVEPKRVCYVSFYGHSLLYKVWDEISH